MSRTIREWQALLDGTSSGDWEAGEGGVEIFAVTDRSRSFVADAGSHLLSCQGEALAEARKDAGLIAAAPEAVAEVIRLRTLLEAGVEMCESADTPNAKTLAKVFTTMSEGN